MTYESTTLRLSVQCPACGESTPVNGLLEKVACTACGTEVGLGGLWPAAFGDEERGEALLFEPGQGRSCQLLAPMVASFAYGRRGPRCQDCKHELPPKGPWVQQALEHGGAECPGCARWISVRPADAFAKRIVPGAAFLVHEEQLGSARSSETEPVVMACQSCGASLEVDGSTRMVTCGYCDASNFLPDPLWQALHPKVKAQVFFVVSELTDAQRVEAVVKTDATDELESSPVLAAWPESALLRLAEQADGDAQAALAANKRLPPAVLAVLAERGDWEVLQALARNPKTPDASLPTIAASDDSDVLAALAERTHLTPEAMRVLLRNPELRNAARERLQGRLRSLDPADVPPELQEAARMSAFRAEPVETLQRSTAEELTAGLVELAVTHDDWRTRQALAQHPAASSDALAKLARDDDSDVVQAVARHPNLSDDTLSELARHDDYKIRIAIAKHPSLSAQRMEGMAGGDADNEVQCALAQRTDLTPTAARALASREGMDEDALVYLARNPVADADLLERLAQHRFQRVWESVAAHPDVPDALLYRLATETTFAVAEVAQRHPNYARAAAPARRRLLLKRVALAAVVFGCLGIAAFLALGAGVFVLW